LELNERFKKLRTDKNYSVYKLSKISDVSENYIRSIEKGSAQPSVLILEKVLKALGTNLAEFFNGDEEVLYPTDFERKLIRSARMLDEEKAQAALHIIQLMAK